MEKRTICSLTVPIEQFNIKIILPRGNKKNRSLVVSFHAVKLSVTFKRRFKSRRFLFRNHLFKRLLIIYATNPSSLSGLSVKGDRDTSSLPFTTRKGVRSYEAINFPNHY